MYKIVSMGSYRIGPNGIYNVQQSEEGSKRVGFNILCKTDSGNTAFFFREFNDGYDDYGEYINLPASR